jgi:dihydropteroate synthase
MGICNVTPDSFSDGGRFLGPADARARVDELLAHGADIVDVGGESTRPGSKPVPPAEQLARVLPVIRHAAERGACISIDTTSPVVAAACLDAGAHAVNDVSLLRDEELARVVAGSGAAFVLSHARAPQESMPGFGRWPEAAYGDVVSDVVADWERAAARAVELGVPRAALVMDPGLGFSKASRHSFELLRRARELVTALQGKAGDAGGVVVPVLFGASRKSFLTLVEGKNAGARPSDDRSAPSDRDGASIAAALHAVRAGVAILRVHDVRATRQAIDMDNVLRTNRRKI